MLQALTLLHPLSVHLHLSFTLWDTVANQNQEFLLTANLNDSMFGCSCFLMLHLWSSVFSVQLGPGERSVSEMLTSSTMTLKQHYKHSWLQQTRGMWSGFSWRKWFWLAEEALVPPFRIFFVNPIKAALYWICMFHHSYSVIQITAVHFQRVQSGTSHSCWFTSVCWVEKKKQLSHKNTIFLLYLQFGALI